MSLLAASTQVELASDRVNLQVAAMKKARSQTGDFRRRGRSSRGLFQNADRRDVAQEPGVGWGQVEARLGDDALVDVDASTPTCDRTEDAFELAIGAVFAR
jgi:hypothetical protein